MARRDNRSAAYFIMGASDLAFILLFFFMMVGGETQRVEPIRLPIKALDTASTEIDTTLPLEIRIDSLSASAAYSRMEVRYGEYVDTLSYSNKMLATAELHAAVAEDLRVLVERLNLPNGPPEVAIYSDPEAFYGFVALVLAACKENNLECNLMYAIED